ncbi:hypothetical protein EVAR_49780_1 [Eumeta japonica]|uniref:Uncharacterized protein n=1 Tax=Eumeta variegata TaxID=151549 RepID=A0A4C1Y2W8_EUMVA|nr:hypothetical protein EVAR_49780_1 [Eumeta japonica]
MAPPDVAHVASQAGERAPARAFSMNARRTRLSRSAQIAFETLERERRQRLCLEKSATLTAAAPARVKNDVTVFPRYTVSVRRNGGTTADPSSARVGERHRTNSRPEPISV